MDIPPADIKVEAVKGITFTCHPGRIYSLLGPNGAGKTTTLRMIATILKPTAGQIMVNGHNVVNAPTAVRANIGFLTGSTKLYERLTPDELIAYFAGFYDISPSEFESRKQKLYDLLDIHPFAKKRIGRLSTGMKQKVSIARTMIHDPQVVIFDEPTSGLDVITAQAIIQLVRDCKAQGKTVIFSTHIMGEVELLCDDLGIIHQGQMLYNGTLTDFMQSNEGIPLVEAFINVVANAA
ncbi:UNVERIFIED_CONTAM: hypothetical protein GTU68_002732 [Idotea baltica]|nr:hypothetical protein [Idotea baltica]